MDPLVPQAKLVTKVLKVRLESLEQLVLPEQPALKAFKVPQEQLEFLVFPALQAQQGPKELLD